MALYRYAGYPFGQADTLSNLDEIQQLTGDYAAAASHQQALAIFRDLGSRLDQAETFNYLGELSSRTSATGQSREHHSRALEIARDISAPLEEARALEGIGHGHLHDGNPKEAVARLRQALAIYQRIGAPAAQRVQETLHHPGQTFTTAEPQPTVPGSEGNRPRTPSLPMTPSRDKSSAESAAE